MNKKIENIEKSLDSLSKAVEDMSESQREFQKYAKICFKTVNALLYEVKEINKKLNADDDNELYHVV